MFAGRTLETSEVVRDEARTLTNGKIALSGCSSDHGPEPARDAGVTTSTSTTVMSSSHKVCAADDRLHAAPVVTYPKKLLPGRPAPTTLGVPEWADTFVGGRT